MPDWGFKWMGRSDAWRPAEPAHTLFLAPGCCWDHGPADAANAADEPPQACSSFADWCAANPRGQARLVFSGQLVHHLVAPAQLPLPDDDALRAWARHQFVHYHGSVADQWPLATWCQGDQRGASALHGCSVDELMAQAQAHDVSLLAALPWWPVALRAAAAQVPALQEAERADLWVVDAGLVTHVQLAAQQVLAVQSRWLDQPTHQALDELLRQEAEAASGQQSTRVVLGYGLTDAPQAVAAAQVLGELNGPAPNLAWVLAA